MPFRATVSFSSGPDGEGQEESDRALSCSSRDKTIPSPCSSVESRVWGGGGGRKSAPVNATAGDVCMCVCVNLLQK